MKKTLNTAIFGGIALLLVVQGCKPYTEEGIDLPGGPEATISWDFIDAIDSTGQVVGIDSEYASLAQEPGDSGRTRTSSLLRLPLPPPPPALPPI